MNKQQQKLKINASTEISPYQWVAVHGDYLYAFASSKVDDDEQARDLVQETFLAALEGLDKFEGRSSERTWLTSILKYKIIDWYRKKSAAMRLSDAGYQHRFFEEADGHWIVDARPREFGIHDTNTIEYKELQRILAECMEKLPALWKNIFVMKFINDDCTDSICTEIGVSAGNYWVIIHRTKLNLRACLQKNWE